ncbi:hypothetical protein [Ralstonia solanacearum]|uniref:hypothetical protein n=1 Tax=Ralstonia solanacearum TaxID=305 RepID=UPI000A631448|nr:hypothetical protein [Ralstonia solanacearum]
MQTDIPRQPGRDLYLQWVEQNSKRRWPKFATLDEACSSGPAFELHTALASAWPLTQTMMETSRPPKMRAQKRWAGWLALRALQ